MFGWDKSDLLFQQPIQEAAVLEAPAAKSKANIKSTPGAAQAIPALSAKPGKPLAPEQSASLDPPIVTLTGFDTAAHAAVVLAFQQACTEIHQQINAKAGALKSAFRKILLEEEANATRWQDCVKWMATPVT